MAQKPTPRFNPRGGDRRGQRPLTARQSSPLWYGLAFLILLGVAQMYYLTPGGRQIPYSEFKSLLKNGQVAEIAIADQAIRGTLKQDQPGSDGKPTKQFATTRVEDPKLTEELEAKGVKYTGEVVNHWLPDLLGWIIPLVFLIGIWGFFFRRMSGAEGGVMSFARSRAKIYADDEVKVRFTDVAGVDEAREELKEIVEFLKNPKKYTNLGGRIPKGVLLVGPPGTGKTLLARAVAGEAHVPFFSLSGSEFVEMFVGVGAARIRDLFQQAEAKAPCIVFIDELDALGKVRVQSPIGSHEEREQTLNQLLAEMDGFDARKGLIIMAATNRPETLDSALMRPGRFDRQVLVDRPDKKGREAILRVHARNKPLGEDVDLSTLARQTSGLAGADLANICNEAAIFAARAHRNELLHTDFDAAVERVVAGMQSRRTLTEHERRVVAWHEAGHALCAELLPGVDRVHKISIVPRGSALGYTLNLPEEDRYLKTREELIDHMTVLLGGRVAEELVFGAVTTGAANDLHRVAEISRAMIHDYAMGTSITSRKISAHGGEVSDRTRELRDEEQQHLADEARRAAARLLSEHREQLDELAGALLRNEVLERRDIDQIMVGTPRFRRGAGGLRVVAADPGQPPATSA